MPAVPRAKGKGKKIAYAILGVPANIAAKPSKRDSKLNKELIFDETARIR